MASAFFMRGSDLKPSLEGWLSPTFDSEIDLREDEGVQT